MKDKDRIIIKKIISYISDVLNYTNGFNFDDFMADKKTITACAFSISQIGELSKNIDEVTQQTNSNIPWRSIKGMRNKIIHDYENIDFVVLWGTITKSLPDLLSQLNLLID